jgi:hypothetical protein
VAWGLFNLVVGFFLFQRGKISADNNLSLIVFFAGVVFLSVVCAKNFVNKDKI